MMWARVARAAAILIAVLGAVDPVLTWTRRIKPTVAVIASDPTGDSAGLVDRVANTLAGDFVVVRGPLAGASAVVSVGDRVTTTEIAGDRPGIALMPRLQTPRVTIAALDVASRVSLDARVPVTAAVHAVGARGKTVEVTLRANGVAADRHTREIASDDERFDAPLGFLPTEIGAVALQVAARVLPAADATTAGARDAVAPHARADAVVDVQRRTWHVLFFDRRPSWASTFVRRSLEDDTRFDVISRIETSRAVSTATAGAPPSLSDPRSLAPFDAVVVGAPDALNDGDVAALTTFARERAGAVVLLMDQHTPGPYERMIGAATWHVATEPSPLVLFAPGLGRIQASEMAWPAPLPLGAQPVATVEPMVGPAGASRSPYAETVVWSTPLGAGRVIVSGALDAWRFRESTASTFDRFWRGVIGEAADATPGPIDVRVESSVLTTDASSRVYVSLRDVALGAAALPSAELSEITSGVISPSDGNSSRSYLPLWSNGEPGAFSGVVRAPSKAGQYRLTVSNGTLTESVPIIVAPTAVPAMDDERPLIAAWAAAHGGVAVDEDKIGEVRAALARAIHPDAAPQRTYPMRSAWWIVPFALALGVEWTQRRKTGQQ